MEPTIKSGKHLAEHADLSGSRFRDVNLASPASISLPQRSE